MERMARQAKSLWSRESVLMSIVLLASFPLVAWDYWTEEIDVMHEDGSYTTTTRRELRRAK